MDNKTVIAKELSRIFLLKVKFVLFVSSFWIVMMILSSTTFGSSGKYLVATHASNNNDFARASENFLGILDNDSFDPLIVQEALISLVLSNNLKSAILLSELAVEQKLVLPTAGLISLVHHYKNTDFKSVHRLLSQHAETLPMFLITLANGWTEIANGSFKSGLEFFTSLDGASRYLGLYNCAIAFALNGDFQNASSYLEELEGKKLKFDETQIQAMAQIYSKNNQNSKAISLLESKNENSKFNEFKKLLFELKDGKQLDFKTFNSPSDALANVFYLMGNTGENTKKNPVAAGFYIQLAVSLAEKKDFYNMRLAETLIEIQVFDYSIKTFNQVSRQSPFYLRAQLGIVDAMVEDGNNESAKSILEQLIKEDFEEFIVFDTLADIFRAKEDYKTAIYYYDAALENTAENFKYSKWATFFVRGIAYDQSGDWKKAKADLENALRLSPNHPEVLNYFGYSLIERNETLEKALVMIENAVSQRPESGYIVDSLAWGLFRLGQYEEAIVPMERAIQLEPHDPIVNDHLGDVLWMIGRKREATFQWRRALLFNPSKENEKKIRKKLKFGITDL